MARCEFCDEEVDTPSHVVVHGRVFLNDPEVCSGCGDDDESLIAFLEEHQPDDVAMVKRELGLA